MQRKVVTIMKLIETVTEANIKKLYDGESIGFFPYMILEDDDFYYLSTQLCQGYYFYHSAEKEISPIFNRLIEYQLKFHLLLPIATNSYDYKLGQLIRSTFIDKWKRVYNVLITEQYNPLNNSEHNETKSGTNSATETHTNSKSRLGNNSDTITYDTEVEDNGQTGTHETVTRNADTQNDIYGFNSINPSGDTKSTEEISETTVGDSDKNTNHNTQTKTGTETKLFGLNETENNTGNNTSSANINESITKSGRDGSGASLIKEELNLRNTQIFFDIVYRDIDSIATLQIYI